MKKSRIISAGIAMFAMMFGAGNVIFPLELGRDAGPNIWYALAGFSLTAIIVPLLGMVAMVLYNGDYRKFLGTMGKVPAKVTALLCMVLIGPFGCIPRCVTISYAATHWYFPELSLLAFSMASAGIIFVLTASKSGVIGILGKFLGPVKFCLLLLIVLVGVWVAAPLTGAIRLPVNAFIAGMLEGYGTMDLLSVIFFTGLICRSLRDEESGEECTPVFIKRSIYAGIFGILLLAVVYTGFCWVASLYASQIQGIDKSQLLSALASLILGSYGGILANIAVALSCLTTSIALTTVFSDYVSKELCGRRVPYIITLVATVIVSCVMTNLGFRGIMSFLMPIITVCYPSLIVLAIVNIAQKFTGFRYIRFCVGVTFLVFLCLQLWK